MTRTATIFGLFGLLLLLPLLSGATTETAKKEFLQLGHRYHCSTSGLDFEVKVLEVIDTTWIRAECPKVTDRDGHPIPVLINLSRVNMIMPLGAAEE